MKCACAALEADNQRPTRHDVMLKVFPFAAEDECLKSPRSKYACMAGAGIPSSLDVQFSLDASASAFAPLVLRASASNGSPWPKTRSTGVLRLPHIGNVYPPGRMASCVAREASSRICDTSIKRRNNESQRSVQSQYSTRVMFNNDQHNDSVAKAIRCM